MFPDVEDEWAAAERDDYGASIADLAFKPEDANGIGESPLMFLQNGESGCFFPGKTDSYPRIVTIMYPH